jgi:colanic acid/amylovoran biosynthesis glycosyltransferase
VIVREKLGEERTDLMKTEASSGEKLKVAYIMSRFPKITETFILYEMLALEQQEVQVELYPLLRERTNIMHLEAKPFVERAHYHPFLSFPILKIQFYFLKRKPRAYLVTLLTLIRSNWSSFRFITSALGIFPKSVYFAYLMQSQGIDHVPAHFASHPAAAAFIIHRLTGISYSFTAHGSDIHRDRHMLCEKVAEASFVVPVSLYNRDVILSACGEGWINRMTVIHCGVDTRVFTPITGKKFDKGSTIFSILCIGTLHEVKGQIFLIEACKLLHDRGIDFACCFVGDGTDEEALKKKVGQIGLTKSVHFLGRKTRDEIANLLQEADVLVAPSVPSSDGRLEGIPVVLMEAMASGVPVVASRLSGIPELVEDGCSGFLTPPGDAHAIADALERLQEDQGLRRSLGEAGRQKIMRDFDMYKNAATLAGCFDKAVGQL